MGMEVQVPKTEVNLSGGMGNISDQEVLSIARLWIRQALTSVSQWNALYMENMLRVESSAVGEIIGSRMLMAVVDRLIEIDVEIRWEHILHEDSSKVYVFDMEMDDDEENEEDPGKPGSDSDGCLCFRKYSLGEVADKMDVLMEMTLDHLKVCADEGRLLQVYDTLMDSFQSTILNTHKSKFTQAVMYVLCFRMKSLIDDPKQRLLVEQLPLKQIVEHMLNPVKVCLPSVVEEFLRQVKALHLFDVSEFMGSNNLLETEESKAFGGVERLDMFFPFDPYLLKQSDRFVRPNFTFWSMVQTPVEEDVEDNMIDESGGPWDEDFYRNDCTEDFSAGNEVNCGSNGGLPESQSDHDDFDAFEYSMNKMSITPRRTAFRMTTMDMSSMPPKVCNMPARLLPHNNSDW